MSDIPAVSVYLNGMLCTSEAVPFGCSLADIILHHGHATPCGGNGTCGRCAVKAVGTLSPPDKAELAVLHKITAEKDVRLACQAKVQGNVSVYLEESAHMRYIRADSENMPSPTNPRYKSYGLAIDIGTTTIAAALYGPVGALAIATCPNPQNQYAADVIGRIQAALQGAGHALQSAVCAAVTNLLGQLCWEQNIPASKIDFIALSGNTTMLYLLKGLDPSPLSFAPFEADHLFGETTHAKALFANLNTDTLLYLPPCIGAFVGADITAAILYSGMIKKQKTSLLMDIGTNGELALYNDGKLTCCSTAAGPAFEGVGISCGCYAVDGAIDKVWQERGLLRFSTLGDAPAKGLCGSGIIDLMAVLLEAGVVDETGAMCQEHALAHLMREHNGQPAIEIAEGILFTAEDVRQVQMAKGAVRAGVETLLAASDIPISEVKALFLAGGFGCFLNLNSAASIGLIPPLLLDKTVTLGNAALAGTASMLANATSANEVAYIQKNAQLYELGGNPLFMQYYMEYMLFDEP